MIYVPGMRYMWQGVIVKKVPENEEINRIGILLFVSIGSSLLVSWRCLKMIEVTSSL